MELLYYELYSAILKNNTYTVGTLIAKNDFLVNFHLPNQPLPIVLATQFKRTDCVKILLNNGANVIVTDELVNLMPVQIAAQNTDKDYKTIFKLLWNAGRYTDPGMCAKTLYYILNAYSMHSPKKLNKMVAVMEANLCMKWNDLFAVVLDYTFLFHRLCAEGSKEAVRFLLDTFPRSILNIDGSRILGPGPVPCNEDMFLQFKKHCTHTAGTDEVTLRRLWYEKTQIQNSEHELAWCLSFFSLLNINAHPQMQLYTSQQCDIIKMLLHKGCFTIQALEYDGSTNSGSCLLGKLYRKFDLPGIQLIENVLWPSSSKVTVGTSLELAVKNNYQYILPGKIQSLLNMVSDPSLVPTELGQPYLMCKDHETGDVTYVRPLISVFHISLDQTNLLRQMISAFRSKNIFVNVFYANEAQHFPFRKQEMLGHKIRAAEHILGIQSKLCETLLNTLFAAGEDIPMTRAFIENGLVRPICNNNYLIIKDERMMCPFRGPDKDGEWAQKSSTPYLPELRELSRCAIRNAIQKQDKHVNLYSVVRKLHLPTLLQKYVLYDQL